MKYRNQLTPKLLVMMLIEIPLHPLLSLSFTGKGGVGNFPFLKMLLWHWFLLPMIY